MKTEYKYIYFEKLPNPGKKTMKWVCKNRDNRIVGYVIWWGGWWKYVYSVPAVLNVILDDKCHDDISDFLKQLNKYQRVLWAKKRKKKW